MDSSPHDISANVAV